MVLIKGPNGVVVDVPASIASGIMRSGQHSYVDVPAAPVTAPEAPRVVTEPVVTEVVAPVATEVMAPVVTDPVPAAPVVAPEAPRGNASRDEFAAYATALGVEFPAEATRDEIRAAVAEKE